MHIECKHIISILAFFMYVPYVMEMSITPAQSRAARGLVAMTQASLAETSGVSLRTIAHFESAERTPIPANLAAIRSALESAGVAFINDGRQGVQLRRHK